MPAADRSVHGLIDIEPDILAFESLAARADGDATIANVLHRWATPDRAASSDPHGADEVTIFSLATAATSRKARKPRPPVEVIRANLGRLTEQLHDELTVLQRRLNGVLEENR